MKPRRTKKQVTFEFSYQEKNYVINRDYQAQPAKIVLADGKILFVHVWNLIPLKPLPDNVEEFDPQQQPAAELAQSIGAFLAELVEK